MWRGAFFTFSLEVDDLTAGEMEKRRAKGELHATFELNFKS
jgi:hypothetical protein